MTAADDAHADGYRRAMTICDEMIGDVEELVRRREISVTGPDGRMKTALAALSRVRRALFADGKPRAIPAEMRTCAIQGCQSISTKFFCDECWENAHKEPKL